MRKALPVLSALALVFLLVQSPLAKDPVPGKLKSRWPIKTSLPDHTDLKKTGALISLADFLALDPAAEHASTEFEKVRYDKAAGAKFGEGQILRTKGYVRLVAYEDDGDYHIQITETPDTFENSLVVEVPNDNDQFVTDAPDVLAAAKTVRAWVIHNLLHDAEPGLGSIHRMIGQAYVQVTGQLFFDSEHQAAMASGVFRGKTISNKKLPSKTSWELHPVTDMAFAPKPH